MSFGVINQPKQNFGIPAFQVNGGPKDGIAHNQT